MDGLEAIYFMQIEDFEFSEVTVFQFMMPCSFFLCVN